MWAKMYTSLWNRSVGVGKVESKVELQPDEVRERCLVYGRAESHERLGARAVVMMITARLEANSWGLGRWPMSVAMPAHMSMERVDVNARPGVWV